MDTRNLGGRERDKDERDYLLGSVQAPVAIPSSFLPDNTWLKRNYQGQTPFCGEHAATHFKAILDHDATGAVERKTPRFGTIKLKDPESPVYDGFPVEAGTDMRAIFQWLRQIGAPDFEPLGNDVTLPWATYCAPSVITPEMDASAGQSTIKSFAFAKTDFESLCQAIYQNKAVILLIKVDESFWGTSTPTFTTPTFGHFLVADGYSQDAIRVIDSAEPNDAFAVKMINKQYVTPTFFFEAGTAIDTEAVVAAVTPVVNEAAAIVPEIESSPSSPPQKETLLDEVEEIVEDIAKVL
jgi:hypothetical protein